LPIGVSTCDYNCDGPRSLLLMTWPIYAGGKIGAAQKRCEGELTGARAELLQAEERLDFQLIARYFGLRPLGMAGRLLRQSPDYQRLLRDLGVTARPG
jgi:hypothetical protein